MERLTSHGQQPASQAQKGDPQASQRLWVISPCFNRPADAQNLCRALTGLVLPPDLSPALVLVDNASDPPIAHALPERPLPEPWRLIHLPQPTNGGGSGGFNAGMVFALGQSRNFDLIWLLDSDAEPEPKALVRLIDALALPDVAMAGSTLIDPATREPFECGGFIDQFTGEYVQGPAPGDDPVACHYLAACSILTTAGVVRQAGLFPDTFLNGDDVGWGCRVRQATRGRLLGVPASRVAHPQPDRMRAAARYFAARGAMVALAEAGVPVFGRAMREAARAAAMHATGLHALGELHLRGLADAADGRVMGPLPQGVDPGNPDRPGLTREQAKEEVSGKARVVGARGRRSDWFNKPGSIAVEAQGGWTITTTPFVQARSAATAMLKGLRLAMRLHKSKGSFGHALPARLPHEVRGGEHGLSIVIVAYNRKDALLRTLTHLSASEPMASAEIIVVDNASADGTAEAVREAFPTVRLIELSENTGVAAFNRGVEAATGNTVLILDDDSWPDATALSLALELLSEREDVVGVALHPRHPNGGRSEWPFARRVHAACDAWPVMGCGNLVRKSAWQRVGGYCEPYFLYRNDTDLALSLGTIGKVWFDPSWVVWHDSPAATRKSVRWCHLATRNWLWMARRHGQSGGVLKWMGVVQAFRLAGLRRDALAAVVRGVREGLTTPCPPTTAGNEAGWKALANLRLGKAIAAADRYVGPCQTHPTPPAQHTSATSSSATLPTASST
ncbi:MAG: glycosyltransferase family 2 protein [Phycisphaerales bacterium JB064]